VDAQIEKALNTQNLKLRGDIDKIGIDSKQQVKFLNQKIAEIEDTMEALVVQINEKIEKTKQEVNTVLSNKLEN